jgi:hypothetical protein
MGLLPFCFQILDRGQVHQDSVSVALVCVATHTVTVADCKPIVVEFTGDEDPTDACTFTVTFMTSSLGCGTRP